MLQEAKDPSVPLFERLKFLGIYSSNLDEFFRVRVAAIKTLIRLGKKTKRQLEFQPEMILEQIRKTVTLQQKEFVEIYKNQIFRCFFRMFDILVYFRINLQENGSETCLKAFLEGLRSILTEFQPVPSHGDPYRTKFYVFL